MKEYQAEVEAAYPDEGTSVAEVAVRTGGGRLLYAYPLYELLVRASKMTLVHSHTAREQVLESCPEQAVRRVRMGIEIPNIIEREEARSRLGLETGLMLASFGLVTPEKRISAALRCLKRLIDDGMDVDYYLVGGVVSHYDALAEARELGIADRVHQSGRVSEEDFWLYVFAADICFNLRYPTAGETSATLLRLLAAGRAVMVTDQIHTLDYPDSIVSRVALEGDEDGLYCDVRELLRHPRRRLQLEANSRKFISEEHNVDGMVEDYIDCVEAARNLPALDIVLPDHLKA
jgi:glycosyltransferase involved in cell wall biosynthesis